MKKDLKDKFIQQLKDVINEYEKFKQDNRHNNRIASSIITRAKAVVNRIVGQNSEYYKRIEKLNPKIS